MLTLRRSDARRPRTAARTVLGVVTVALAALCAVGPAGAQQDAGAALPPGRQGPVPSPAAPVQRADKPLKASPAITTIRGHRTAQPITIDDAVAVALAANRQLAQAAETLMQAHGATTTARAGQWFNASANYSLTRNNEELTTNLGEQSLVMQKQYVSQLTASISLPLDLTGALKAATGQAQFEELAAKLDANRVRNDVVLQVKRAFYEALRSEALVTVAETSLTNARTQLVDAEVRLAAGTVTRYDVLSAKTTVASAEQTLRQAQSDQSQAMASLRSAMGVDINTPFELTTKGAIEVPPDRDGPAPPAAPSNPVAATPEGQFTPGKPLGDLGAAQAAKMQDFVVGDRVKLGQEFDAVLREALAKRPEIGSANASIAAAQKGITVSRQSGLPSFSVGYYETYSPDASGLSTKKLSGYAALSVNVPIIDSGTTRGRVEQARARLSAAETARRTQVDTVMLEVRQAWLDLTLGQEQVGTARQELAQADEAYRLAQLRYSAGVTAQAGVSPLTELSGAQSALARAQSDYANALYNYNSARSTLDRAVGRYTDLR